jgi:hypothetical protein
MSLHAVDGNEIAHSYSQVENSRKESQRQNGWMPQAAPISPRLEPLFVAGSDGLRFPAMTLAQYEVKARCETPQRNQ